MLRVEGLICDHVRYVTTFETTTAATTQALYYTILKKLPPQMHCELGGHAIFGHRGFPSDSVCVQVVITPSVSEMLGGSRIILGKIHRSGRFCISRFSTHCLTVMFAELVLVLSMKTPYHLPLRPYLGLRAT